MEPVVYSPAAPVPPGGGVHTVQAGGHHAPYHRLAVIPHQPCQPGDTPSSVDAGLHHYQIFPLKMFQQPGTDIGLESPE